MPDPRSTEGDQWRGHQIQVKGRTWRYVDTGRPVADDPNRACGWCGHRNTSEGHDHCLGTLPGVINACCGHGIECEANIVFDDGSRVSGTDALMWIEKARRRIIANA